MRLGVRESAFWRRGREGLAKRARESEGNGTCEEFCQISFSNFDDTRIKVLLLRFRLGDLGSVFESLTKDAVYRKAALESAFEFAVYRSKTSVLTFS